MAITTLDGVIAGMQPPQPFHKNGAAWGAAGRYRSHLYDTGIPGAAAAPAPGVAGAALTTYAGQIPFINPGSGNQYLARLQGIMGNGGTIFLLDRLWHNSGLSVTIATSQTVNSVAWPARDNNGSINGVGVMVALEVTTVMGAGTPTITLGYTNDAGTAGRSAVTPAVPTTMVAGQWVPLVLQGGDSGVRSIQTFQLSATMTSGAFSLVAYRLLASLEASSAFSGYAVDALTGGMPRLYDNTVPFLVTMSSANGAANVAGSLITTVG